MTSEEDDRIAALCDQARADIVEFSRVRRETLDELLGLAGRYPRFLSAADTEGFRSVPPISSDELLCVDSDEPELVSVQRQRLLAVLSELEDSQCTEAVSAYQAQLAALERVQPIEPHLYTLPRDMNEFPGYMVEVHSLREALQFVAARAPFPPRTFEIAALHRLNATVPPLPCNARLPPFGRSLSYAIGVVLDHLSQSSKRHDQDFVEEVLARCFVYAGGREAEFWTHWIDNCWIPAWKAIHLGQAERE